MGSYLYIENKNIIKNLKSMEFEGKQKADHDF